MLLSLLLLCSPASARCTLSALQTRVESAPDPTRLRRVDRWSWSVGPGPVDCTRLDFASPQAAPIVDLRVEIDRLDGRDPRVDASRIEAVADADDPGFGEAAGLRVHAPEVRPGDVVVVEVERSWPRGERLDWRPGARGPLKIATLDVPAELPTTTAGGVVRQGRRRWWLEEVPAGEPEPFDDGPAGTAGGAWRHGVALLLPARRPLRGLGDAGRAATLRAWRQAGGGARRVAPPRDALLRWCVQGPDTPCQEVGGVAWRIDAGADARWGWVEAGAWPGGEIVAPAGARSATVVVSAPRARLRLAAAPEAAAFEDIVPTRVVEGQLGALLADYAPVDTEVARRLTPGARMQWSVAALDGVAVLPDRAAAEQLVAALAVKASLPEPGVGAGFRGRRGDPAIVGEVLDLLRARMHPGRLPRRPELAPRSLVQARRSGWGNPWELALVLTRYLRQLKLDAVPLPLRPARWGPPMPGAVDGWPAAVVAVAAPGADPVYIDPSCPTCAVGQLLPELDAAWVLSPGVERLPPLPASSWRRRWEGAERVVEITGPLAVDLRRRVLSWPVEARSARLARLFGGAGATLEALVRTRFRRRMVLSATGERRFSRSGSTDEPRLSWRAFRAGTFYEGHTLVTHEGITEALDHLRLRLSGAAAAPPPDILLGGSPGDGYAPVRGRWIERVPLPDGASTPSAPVIVEAPGLRWIRRVEDGAWVERLEIERHTLDPAATQAVLDRVAMTWGRPPIRSGG